MGLAIPLASRTSRSAHAHCPLEDPERACTRMWIGIGHARVLVRDAQDLIRPAWAIAPGAPILLPLPAYKTGG